MSPQSVTILVVEDEPCVLAVIGETLERLGYRVLAATSAESAIALTQEHAAAIQVLLLDVVMPHLSGPQLRDRLQDLLDPDIPTIYMTGHPDVREGWPSDIVILDKPLTAEALLQSVLQVTAYRRTTEPLAKKPPQSELFLSPPASANSKR